RVRAPALILHGENDEYGSTAHPERIARATGGRMVIIPGTGHLPHREAADRVLAEITDFLRGVA
ncbi:MAG: alpha/beta hydrolase, partial [Paracoccus sp. (in: a-proteobacteria)]|nr:alpha/beta hydrolase [Paracoccus sp. (in: a-proteobacteria)]